ncbi:MAG: hypothetical protein ACI8W8_004999 [Rhodothermales bacterium]|jgi:hypothetical protein
MMRTFLVFIALTLAAHAQNRKKPVVFCNWDMEQYGSIEKYRTVKNNGFPIVNQLRLESNPTLMPVVDPPADAKNGPAGKALFFDGSQNRCSRSMYNWHTKRAFDMRFWIRPIPPEPTGAQTVLQMPRAWEVAWKAGELSLHVFYRDKSVTLKLPCEADAWSEVAVSYRTTGEIVFAVNGEEVKRKLKPGDEMNKVDLPIRLGTNSFFERPFRGYLDNVHFQSFFEEKRGNPLIMDKNFGRFL